MTDFEEKAEVFNSSFARQCPLITNDSKVSPRLHFLTEKCLSKVVNTDILTIIQNLNPVKAYGHDNISLPMLKIYGNSLCRPLELIFNEWPTNGIFPSDWKEGNIVSLHKKYDKQRVSNYRLISLLPIYSKISERLEFHERFGLFIENDIMPVTDGTSFFSAVHNTNTRAK